MLGSKLQEVFELVYAENTVKHMLIKWQSNCKSYSWSLLSWCSSECYFVSESLGFATFTCRQGWSTQHWWWYLWLVLDRQKNSPTRCVAKDEEGKNWCSLVHPWTCSVVVMRKPCSRIFILFWVSQTFTWMCLKKDKHNMIHMNFKLRMK